jgi:RNA polymerase sigma-70 factor (ECF subfamily)
VDPVLEVEPDLVDPERAMVAREQLAAVRAGLDELPERVRTAFLMHRLKGLSCAEIGADMGLSERMIRNYVVRAMVHCRQRLDQAHDEGGAS